MERRKTEKGRENKRGKLMGNRKKENESGRGKRKRESRRKKNRRISEKGKIQWGNTWETKRVRGKRER